MESANLHHHQQHHQLLPDQHVASSSSPLSISSCYGVGSTHAWTPNTILNSTGFNPNINEVSISSRDSSRQQNDILAPSPNSSMIHDLDFNWAINGGGFSSTQSAHDLHLARIKEELSDSYQKFSEMVNNATTIQDFQSHPTSYSKNEHKDLNEYPSTTGKLLLRNLSSGSQTTGLQPSAAGDYYSDCSAISRNLPAPSRGSFSQIFPTINISNLNQSSPTLSSPTHVNIQASDFLTSARFCGNLGQLSHGQLGVLSKESSLFYGLDHMQQPSHKPSNSSTKVSNFTNELVTEAKRNSNVLEPKAAAKRSRLESRASCPPLKVRKEKLGDRIAALQQLVAPFGKTDTASVLKEAIGYINFLQSQVETLTVPYMKPSRNKNSRTMKVGLGAEGNEEAKRDLKSRGLCLVPLSFLSYVTDAGGVWPHPSFSGGT